jgi:hypothetical protein
MPPLPLPVETPLPECLMIDLEQLHLENCHWPIGDALPYKFCGLKRVEPSQSYCAYHHKLSTRPLPIRRDIVHQLKRNLIP